ncbi:iron-sulfur cluster biosynthesis family protein [Paenibacillus hamazuiensis]|uniref:iron-sulfur cluster biosynthesis family protein n=1 Tax=Paenibacillus hamazuiensis TaxID=2936508 RepID=UPI00200E6AA0|nr:iron-sulfur cluster biosynthesis family protein [Paenibacillus hamazuiensis]
MHITFTPAAAEQLEPKLAEPSSRLKLVYDNEGCGCAVNGVPALWIVDNGNPEDRSAKGEPFDVLFQAKDEIYFEDAMLIDYNPERRSFILKSNQQIYTTHLRLSDRRNQ